MRLRWAECEITKICLVGTVGGHLTQLEVLHEAVHEHDVYLVTVPSPHAQYALTGIRRYEVRQILRNPVKFLRNALQSLRIFLRERPDVVITTGAGDAGPTVLIAAALGSRVVFVESFARVGRPSLFGRLFHRWCDLVLYQWPNLKAVYRRGTRISPLFTPSRTRREIPASPSILVLTGTHTLGFTRLLQAVDEQVASNRLAGRVMAQIGHSIYIPQHCEYFRFLPHEDLKRKLSDADVVITHDGSASIGEALSLGKPILVVPRKAAEREVSYRSDQQLARHLAEHGLVVLVGDPARLPEAFERLQTLPQREIDSGAPSAIEVIRSFVARRVEPSPSSAGSDNRIPQAEGLRVVVVSPANPWNHRPGGIRTYTEALVTSLAVAGAEVTVVAPDGGAPRSEQVRLIPLVETRGSSLRFHAKLFLMGPKLRGLAKIVHVQRPDHLLPILPWIRSARRVAVLHGEAGRSVQLRKGALQAAVLRVLEWAGSLFIDAFIAVDEHTRRAYEALFPRLRGKITVIPVGVRAPPTPGPGAADVGDIPGGSRIVLYAGRLEREKNVGLLIDAFPIVLRSVPNAYLLLIGDGREENALRVRAAAAGNERIRIMGPRPRAELWDLIRRSDVVAVPSLFESGPLIALEAISLGTPVVATPFGRIAKVMERWSVGRLSSPNVEEFGRALVDVLQHGRDRYEKACRAAAAELSFDSTLDATLDVYRSLAVHEVAR